MAKNSNVLVPSHGTVTCHGPASRHGVEVVSEYSSKQEGTSKLTRSTPLRHKWTAQTKLNTSNVRHLSSLQTTLTLRRLIIRSAQQPQHTATKLAYHDADGVVTDVRAHVAGTVAAERDLAHAAPLALVAPVVLPVAERSLGSALPNELVLVPEV